MAPVPYYDAFGNQLETTGSANNPFRYAGYVYDSETGLYYLNARYYDPITARFLTEDTYRGKANDPLSLNLYTYCVNNPLIYYDPTGHKPVYSAGEIKYMREKLSDGSYLPNIVRREWLKIVNGIEESASKTISSIVNYTQKHKIEIVTAAAIGLTVAGIVVTGGAATPFAMAAGSAMMGAGISIGATGISDYKDNGRVDKSYREYGANALGGAVTGAFLPAGAGLSLGKSAVWTGVSSAAGSAARQSVNGKVDYRQVAIEGVSGAAVHYGIGLAAPYISRGIQSAKSGIGKMFNSTKRFLADESGYVNLSKFSKGAVKTENAIWDMTKGGKNINGREFSEHALERMAPNTPQVRAELEARALAKGLKRGTDAFNKYVDPRGIPTSVVEDAIQNGSRIPGKTPYTWECATNDVRVIINEFGDVITVMPK